MSVAWMTIGNLRHRGVRIYDLKAEISHRRNNVFSKDERFFGYKTQELENALYYWDQY